MGYPPTHRFEDGLRASLEWYVMHLKDPAKRFADMTLLVLCPGQACPGQACPGQALHEALLREGSTRTTPRKSTVCSDTGRRHTRPTYSITFSAWVRSRPRPSRR